MVFIFVSKQKLKEIREQLEQTVKSSKTNEKLISSEMDHLRSECESFEKRTIPEKDKEIKSLRLEIENVGKFYLFILCFVLSFFNFVVIILCV